MNMTFEKYMRAVKKCYKNKINDYPVTGDNFLMAAVAARVAGS